VDLVDLFGGRWLAVGLDAIILAWLAARLARCRLGLALGERRGLALAGAEGLIELAAQALVLGLQVVDATPKRLAAGTPDRFHARLYAVAGGSDAQTAGRERLKWNTSANQIPAV
jgi:hypothetical protein